MNMTLSKINFYKNLKGDIDYLRGNDVCRSISISKAMIIHGRKTTIQNRVNELEAEIKDFITFIEENKTEYLTNPLVTLDDIKYYCNLTKHHRKYYNSHETLDVIQSIIYSFYEK